MKARLKKQQRDVVTQTPVQAKLLGHVRPMDNSLYSPQISQTEDKQSEEAITMKARLKKQQRDVVTQTPVQAKLLGHVRPMDNSLYSPQISQTEDKQSEDTQQGFNFAEMPIFGSEAGSTPRVQPKFFTGTGKVKQPGVQAKLEPVQRAEEEEMQAKLEPVQRAEEEEMQAKLEPVQRAEEEEMQAKLEPVQRAEEEEMQAKLEPVQRAEEEEMQAKLEPVQRAEEEEMQAKLEPVQRAEEEEMQAKLEPVQRAEEEEMQAKLEPVQRAEEEEMQAKLEPVQRAEEEEMQAKLEPVQRAEEEEMQAKLEPVQRAEEEEMQAKLEPVQRAEEEEMQAKLEPVQRAEEEEMQAKLEPVQRAEEEEMQAKLEPVQRAEEEEMQAKFEPVQRAEEEEMQAKFEPVQRAEEEEMQAKFEPVQRAEEEEMQAKFEPVQRQESKRVNLAPTSIGKPMPKTVQRKMEGAFGADFSGVRIHEGPQAKSINAIAYTQGSNIHFQPGKYQPDTQSGQELLGHELTHVVQQRAGKVDSPQKKSIPINADHSLEAEADQLGAKAARGEVVQVAGANTTLQNYSPNVQRKKNWNFGQFQTKFTTPRVIQPKPTVSSPNTNDRIQRKVNNLSQPTIYEVTSANDLNNRYFWHGMPRLNEAKNAIEKYNKIKAPKESFKGFTSQIELLAEIDDHINKWIAKYGNEVKKANPNILQQVIEVKVGVKQESDAVIKQAQENSSQTKILGFMVKKSQTLHKEIHKGFNLLNEDHDDVVKGQKAHQNLDDKLNKVNFYLDSPHITGGMAATVIKLEKDKEILLKKKQEMMAALGEDNFDSAADNAQDRRQDAYDKTSNAVSATAKIEYVYEQVKSNKVQNPQEMILLAKDNFDKIQSDYRWASSMTNLVTRNLKRFDNSFKKIAGKVFTGVLNFLVNTVTLGVVSIGGDVNEKGTLGKGLESEGTNLKVSYFNDIQTQISKFKDRVVNRPAIDPKQGKLALLGHILGDWFSGILSGFNDIVVQNVINIAGKIAFWSGIITPFFPPAAAVAATATVISLISYSVKSAVNLLRTTIDTIVALTNEDARKSNLLGSRAKESAATTISDAASLAGMYLEQSGYAAKGEKSVDAFDAKAMQNQAFGNTIKPEQLSIGQKIKVLGAGTVAPIAANVAAETTLKAPVTTSEMKMEQVLQQKLVASKADFANKQMSGLVGNSSELFDKFAIGEKDAKNLASKMQSSDKKQDPEQQETAQAQTGVLQEGKEAVSLFLNSVKDTQKDMSQLS